MSAYATHGAPLTLPVDAYDVVDTGDLLPSRADAVVTRERPRSGRVGSGDRDGDRAVRERSANRRGRRSRRSSSPGRANAPPADLAVLASAGSATVTVRMRPVVAILPTGDELVPVGADAAPGEVIETNSLMLGAMVEQQGAIAARIPIAPDDPDVLADTLERLAADADLVLVLSGSAKGTDDHTVAVIERVGSVVVQGVAIKPGHPVVLGVVGSTPVMGVPGYPVSATLAFDLFVTPYLAALAGSVAPVRPTLRGGRRASRSPPPHMPTSGSGFRRPHRRRAHRPPASSRRGRAQLARRRRRSGAQPTRIGRRRGR